MDYCNNLPLGLPSHEIRKIQIIQNSAASFVTKTRKYDHITPMLQGLHWLPVHQRVNCKLICTTYGIIDGAAPTHLNELLSIYAPPRNLRSNSTEGVRLNQPIPGSKHMVSDTFHYSCHVFGTAYPLNYV